MQIADLKVRLTAVHNVQGEVHIKIQHIFLCLQFGKLQNDLRRSCIPLADHQLEVMVQGDHHY